MKLREAIEVEIRIAQKMQKDIQSEIDALIKLEEKTGVRNCTMIEGYYELQSKYAYTENILTNLLKNED